MRKLLLAALSSIFIVLAGCTGGGAGDTAGTSGTPGQTEQPVKLSPEELVLFPGGSGEFQIISGRRPFTATVDNATALVIQGGLDDFKVKVFAKDVLAETPVKVTVKDALNNSATATAKIRPNIITSEVKIEALPAPGSTDISRCQDGTTICAGGFARVTAKLSNPAGTASGRTVRFDLTEGAFGFATDSAQTQFASTVTVQTDAAGQAQAVIKANSDASTQPAGLRVLDEATGSRQSVAFTIGGRTISVVPAKVTLTGRQQGVCGSGSADFQIFGGRAPYSVVAVSPLVSIDPSVVTASGGKFRALVGQAVTCVNATNSVTITDAQGTVIVATIDVQEGTQTPPSLSVAPAAVTISSCSSFASVVYTGANLAIAAPKELAVTLGQSIITISPTKGAANGSYAIGLTNGTSTASIAVTLANLPAAGCP